MPESEGEENEEDLLAGQVQGSSSLSAENLRQSLCQDGEDLGWESDVRGGGLGREGPSMNFSSSPRPLCSPPVAPELPDSRSR